MSNPKYVCVPNGYLEPEIAETGVASWPAKTVIQIFRVSKRKTCTLFNLFEYTSTNFLFPFNTLLRKLSTLLVTVPPYVMRTMKSSNPVEKVLHLGVNQAPQNLKLGLGVRTMMNVCSLLKL